MSDNIQNLAITSASNLTPQAGWFLQKTKVQKTVHLATQFMRALFGRLDMIYFIYFAPTLILFLVWYWSRFNEKSYKIILCSWAGILCLIVVTIGTTSREADGEITKLGLALLVSSPIWFIGPLLAFADKTKWGFYSFVFVALVIPFISIIACFIILAYFHQIWGL